MKRYAKIEVIHEEYDDKLVTSLPRLRQWVGYVNGERVTAGRVTKEEAYGAALAHLRAV